MQIQLFHNKILRNTLTPGFERSVNEALVPLVLSECPDATGILMYEDYIADGFSYLGAWYYPLTVFRGEEASTLWVKWAVNKKHFTDGCPYAYVGEDCIDFAVAKDLPDDFVKVREGRRIAPYSGTVSLEIDAAHPDPLFLAGRYSQSFVDELAYQITAALERTAEVEGIANSSITLSLIFAPGTYMEHTSEGVTYRRLLINAKGCQPRDLWVKWSRPDGAPSTVGTHLADECGGSAQAGCGHGQIGGSAAGIGSENRDAQLIVAGLGQIDEDLAHSGNVDHIVTPYVDWLGLFAVIDGDLFGEVLCDLLLNVESSVQLVVDEELAYIKDIPDTQERYNKSGPGHKKTRDHPPQ